MRNLTREILMDSILGHYTVILLETIERDNFDVFMA